MALDWVAGYLERSATARAGAGRARRAPVAATGAPPERAEPFADVLRDLDDVLMPAITHWQSPRYFAYFADDGLRAGISPSC